MRTEHLCSILKSVPIHCNLTFTFDKGITIIRHFSIKPFRKCVHNYEYEAKHLFLEDPTHSYAHRTEIHPLLFEASQK